MKRYFNDDDFERFRKDFGFLVKAIKKSYGEIDLRLRGNYFNIYYKGNSVAKVDFVRDGYRIAINRKFTKDVFSNEKRFKQERTSGAYDIFKIGEDDKSQLHAFFQKKYLNKISRNIKQINYGEEITFEQMLITDNNDNKEVVIIDRQITERSLKKKRLDLLALKKTEEGKYQFLIIEVKLGNNKELKTGVVEQLQGYINHIQSKTNFTIWKNCYEKVYSQMKRLGLVNGPDHLKIINGVKGIILVGRYSGLAKENIARLRSKNPGLEIRLLANLL